MKSLTTYAVRGLLATAATAAMLLAGSGAANAEAAAGGSAPARSTSAAPPVWTTDGCQLFLDPWGPDGNQGFGRANCANPAYNWFVFWGECSTSGGSTYWRHGAAERQFGTRWSVVTCNWGDALINHGVDQYL